MIGEEFQIADKILPWYKHHGRKDLPWQKSKNAYGIWISEIMLQQTQVATVIPYYQRFMDRFPTISDLGHAEVDDVLAHWSGLGYYARARNLHKAAQLIIQKHRGTFPTEFDNVVALPGIGRSTAGAILAFSDNQRWPILDGNVKRVLCRFYAIEGYPGQREVENQLWQIANKNTPIKQVAKYTQAIMDLGATICVRRNPLCESCPLESLCEGRKQGIESRLPTPKPKKSLPTKEIAMLLILNNKNQILLEKRPPSGIWGGLWSLPECGAGEDIKSYCDSNLGLMGNLKTKLDTYKHSFSHYHLIINPQLLQVDLTTKLKEDNLSWFDFDEIGQLGLPKPVKSLISQLETNNE